MPIHVRCPGCQGQFELHDELAGKTAKCQACQTVMSIPSPNVVQPVHDPLTAPLPATVPPPPHGYYLTRRRQGVSGWLVALIVGVSLLGLSLLCVGGWYLFNSTTVFLPTETSSKVRPVEGPFRDALVRAHGAQKVINIQINDADVHPGFIEFNLTDQIRKVTTGKSAPTDIAWEPKGAGKYDAYAAPVSKSLNEIKESIDWGKVTLLAGRRLLIVEIDPDYDWEGWAGADVLKSMQDRKEKFEQFETEMTERIADWKKQVIARNERQKREERAATQKAVEDKKTKDVAIAKRKSDLEADSKGLPRNGESSIAWVSRYLESGKMNKSQVSVFLTQLAKREYDPRIGPEINQILLEYLAENGKSNQSAVFNALAVWRSAKSDAMIEEMATSYRDERARFRAIRNLIKINPVKAANLIVDGLVENDIGIIQANPNRLLIEIGAPAEDAVLKLLENSSVRFRQIACQILMKIGTQKSIAAIESAMSEGNPKEYWQKVAKQALEEIQSRQ